VLTSNYAQNKNGGGSTFLCDPLEQLVLCDRPANTNATGGVIFFPIFFSSFSINASSALSKRSNRDSCLASSFARFSFSSVSELNKTLSTSRFESLRHSEMSSDFEVSTIYNEPDILFSLVRNP